MCHYVSSTAPGVHIHRTNQYLIRKSSSISLHLLLTVLKRDFKRVKRRLDRHSVRGLGNKRSYQRRTRYFTRVRNTKPQAHLLDYQDVKHLRFRETYPKRPGPGDCEDRRATEPYFLLLAYLRLHECNVFLSFTGHTGPPKLRSIKSCKRSSCFSNFSRSAQALQPPSPALHSAIRLQQSSFTAFLITRWLVCELPVPVPTERQLLRATGWEGFPLASAGSWHAVQRQAPYA